MAKNGRRVRRVQTDRCFRCRRCDSLHLAFQFGGRSLGGTTRGRGQGSRRDRARSRRRRARQWRKHRVVLAADQDPLGLLEQLGADWSVRDQVPALDDEVLLVDAHLEEPLLKRVERTVSKVERRAEASQALDRAVSHVRNPLVKVYLVELLALVPDRRREVVRVVVLQADLFHARAWEQLVLVGFELDSERARSTCPSQSRIVAPEDERFARTAVMYER